MINFMLSILPEPNKVYFPNEQKKDAGAFPHEKLLVISMAIFPPWELDMWNKFQN